MSTPVKTLKVTLNTDRFANPKVTIKDSYADVTDCKVRWERADTSPDFDFVSLDLDRNAFPGQDISANKRRISCNNKGTKGNYRYTITVKRLGREYDSTPHGDGAPDGDKPVIRNK